MQVGCERRNTGQTAAATAAYVAAAMTGHELLPHRPPVRHCLSPEHPGRLMDSISTAAVSMADTMQRLEFEDFPGRSLTVLLFKDVTNSK
jgi:hypothetical protein